MSTSQFKEYPKYTETKFNICAHIQVIGILLFILFIFFCSTSQKQSAADVQKSFQVTENTNKGDAFESYFSIYCDKDCNNEQKQVLQSIIALMKVSTPQRKQQLQSSTIIQRKKHSNTIVNFLQSFYIKKQNVLSHLSQLEYQPKLTQFPLKAVKHQKMTSPHSAQEGFFYGMLNFFFPKDKYKGIDLIFTRDNTKYWRSERNYLTVMSDRLMSVRLIEIDVKDKSQGLLFGLKIDPTLLAVEHRFVNVFLGKYKFQAGSNKLFCTFIECNDQYALILFVIDQINIRYLSIYGEV